MTTHRRVLLTWRDGATARAGAIANGWDQDGGDSMLDFLHPDEYGECLRCRQCRNLRLAKQWGARHRGLDFWSQPEIRVEVSADLVDWEISAHLRYVGGGYGWEQIL